MDPSERYNDPALAIRRMIEGIVSGVWTALPGIVTTAISPKGTISVQPAITGVIRDEQLKQSYVNLPLLVDVPVVFPRGGGYTLTFPVKPGDECLVVFSSRCIDNWWAQGGVQPPFERRSHDLSDGFALVGPFSVPRIGGLTRAVAEPQAISSGAQLRSDDGSMSITLDSAGGLVTVKAPTRITLDAPEVLLPTGDLRLAEGNLSVDLGDITDGGINVHNHVHREQGDGNLTGLAEPAP